MHTITNDPTIETYAPIETDSQVPEWAKSNLEKLGTSMDFILSDAKIHEFLTIHGDDPFEEWSNDPDIDHKKKSLNDIVNSAMAYTLHNLTLNVSHMGLFICAGTEGVDWIDWKTLLGTVIRGSETSDFHAYREEFLQLAEELRELTDIAEARLKEADQMVKDMEAKEQERIENMEKWWRK